MIYSIIFASAFYISQSTHRPPRILQGPPVVSALVLLSISTTVFLCFFKLPFSILYDKGQQPSLSHRTCVRAVVLGSKFRRNHEKGQSSKQAINRVCNKAEQKQSGCLSGMFWNHGPDPLEILRSRNPKEMRKDS